MKFLRNNNGLEICAYDKNQLSIKDSAKDIDINDSRWNSLFKFLLGNTCYFYFLGERVDDVDSTLMDDIRYISERLILNDDFWSILLEVKNASLTVNRSLVSRVWSRYEYPAIIFFKDQSNEKLLMELCGRKVTYYEMVTSLENCYLIHKNSELNVLWLKKSHDMAFPPGDL